MCHQAGYTLRNNEGEQLQVTNVEAIESLQSVNVYNFGVEDWHCYYVSGLNVLVHNSSMESRKPKSGTGKEKATDIPSHAEGKHPYVGENGKQYAQRVLTERYGEGNHERTHKREFSQLKKHGDRGYEKEGKITGKSKKGKGKKGRDKK